MASFVSLDDAIAAGFVVAGPRLYQKYRGCLIHGHDTSGRGVRGHSFAIRIEIPEDFTSNYMGVFSDRMFGKSIEVKLVREWNNGTGGLHTQAGIGTGSGSARHLQMFAGDVYNSAIVAARGWTDAWFRAHPDAITRMNESIRAEKAAARMRA